MTPDTRDQQAAILEQMAAAKRDWWKGATEALMATPFCQRFITEADALDAGAQALRSQDQGTCATCRHFKVDYQSPHTSVVGPFCTRSKIPVRWLDAPGSGDTVPYTEFGCIFHAPLPAPPTGESR